MKIVLDAVAKGRAQRALPETSTSYETGRATLAVAETEQRVHRDDVDGHIGHARAQA